MKRDTPPGALKAGPAGADVQSMKCPGCRIRQLVVIEIQVGGEPVTMFSCSHCDRRWWQGMEGRLSLDSVLGIASAST